MRLDFAFLLSSTALPLAAAALECRDGNNKENGLRADLGYAIYQGVFNDTFGLNYWKGIRYAAPPTGKLRWQAPQSPPRASGDRLVQAVDQPPRCPQSGAFGTPAAYGFNSGPGDEDCLYLNVYAPPNAYNLPVFFWIHGGGNSDFGAVYDPSVLMNTNNNGFITVEIQYRLGAFGYLASSDVKAHGVLNAGLLDQRFALEWVQKYISVFGGDPSRVTLGGESSGASSAMYQSLAYDGQDSNLFTSIIVASPWEPALYSYDDPVPTGNYEAFVELAGCGKTSPRIQHYTTTFNCLVAADTAVLQNASGTVSTTRGHFGTFAFGSPVLDGDFIRERASAQLQASKFSGKRLLVGTNANEGVPLTNPFVTNKTSFDNYLSETYPRLNSNDVKAMTSIYDIDNAQFGNNAARFDTLGDRGPLALNQSSMATGIQQAAYNIDAEVYFHCPAQWFAEAFSSAHQQSWRYQYSIQPAYHGADLPSYWSVNAKLPTPGFRFAFQKIWGNFIINGTPVIAVSDAMAGASNSTVPRDPVSPEQISWPQYSLNSSTMMNLNTTGGIVTLRTVTDTLSYYIRSGDDVVNTFSLANAMTWEGGRGIRCAFWRSVSERLDR